MEEVHIQAEKSRQWLRDLGVDETFYGATEDLRKLYKGSEVEACKYDPV